MKCAVCSKKIEQSFLGKIVGTYVKDEKGKLISICPECQAKHKNDKKALLSQS